MRAGLLLCTALLLCPLGQAAESLRSPRPIMDGGAKTQKDMERDKAKLATSKKTKAASVMVTPGGNGNKDAKATDAKPATGSDGEQARTGPAPAAIEHDIVILTNEQRFLGTVLSDQPDADWLSINTGNGTLRLARERVARVEFGLTARMGRVKTDDLAGLIDLAYWCRANGRNPQALALLTKAVALPDCDLKTRGLYAQLVDEQEGADKALPLYIAYRNAGGTDAELLARLSELEKARSDWEEQMRALGLVKDKVIKKRSHKNEKRGQVFHHHIFITYRV